jgi:dihydrofolate synthase/folylpolyglutamate synthase
MIRAGLEAEGQRVHAYTSPHLARFHERIRLAGTLISEEHLQEILEECETVNGGAQITYFEITTCAALLAFSRVAADYTLLEVGLGGRLDATNVIAQPALSVITPVSIDHQQFLGETLAEIAGEKAGILKRGVPAVIGPQQEAAMDVIEAQAARMGAPLIAYGQHWHVWEERGRLIYQDETGLLDLPLPNLPGAHQIENAGAAIASLRHLGFGETACEAAVTHAFWPARMQRLRQGPLVEAFPTGELWLDGGHNPAAGQAIGAHLAGLPKGRDTWAICGMLNTKDARGYLRPMADHLAGMITVSIPGEENSLPAQSLAEMAADVGIAARPAENVEQAVEMVLSAEKNARVLICGSLYLAGYILRENG